ncbi:MAG: hypothetical protein K9W43_04970 [Candidatus Thorarchaeota archaeon]|nr:hypothetical protein [Candidatus Thorarchaeota archaeon]
MVTAAYISVAALLFQRLDLLATSVSADYSLYLSGVVAGVLVLVVTLVISGYLWKTGWNRLQSVSRDA